MTIEYQKELLKYVTQFSEAKKYLALLDKTVFELGEDQIVFDLLIKYYSQYKVIPSKVDLLEYFNKQEVNVKEDVYKAIVNTIHETYFTLNCNTEQLRESIITEIQKKKSKELFIKYADKIKNGIEVFDDMKKEMDTIVRLADEEYYEDNLDGGFLLQDHEFNPVTFNQGIPTCFSGLNRLTAAGGFYSPQLVVFLAAPKSFKTGTLLTIALGFVRDGLNVYYADAENGVSSIRNRLRQAMLETDLGTLVSREEDKLLQELVDRYKIMGGDLKLRMFPAGNYCVNDVAKDIQQLKNKGWQPDVIFYDSIDHFIPNKHESRKKDKRLQIQDCYFDAIHLNVKLGTFCVTISQVNRKAVGKEVITMSDFGEDFGKAANAHAAFAICRTPEEQEAGIARILPVAQREGVAYKGTNTCFLEMQEDKMIVREIQESRALDLMGDYVDTLEDD